ncbi:MAG: hypothetical protein HKN33_06475 [Pyrinomonadaceae bacterium]|nr:hypothetical protein [Pyrinomonadaceae bacterium]
MKCPVCKDTALEIQDVAGSLVAGVCGNCKGKWISVQSYHFWLESVGPEEVQIDSASNESIETSENAKLCQTCERILTRFKISFDSSLFIDRCSFCLGIWLDQADWVYLNQCDLIRDLDKIATESWQQKVHKDELKSAVLLVYQNKFGKQKFDKVREFKKWVFEQDGREEILSFLRDTNPLHM